MPRPPELLVLLYITCLIKVFNTLSLSLVHPAGWEAKQLLGGAWPLISREFVVGSLTWQLFRASSWK